MAVFIWGGSDYTCYLFSYLESWDLMIAAVPGIVASSSFQNHNASLLPPILLCSLCRCLLLGKACAGRVGDLMLEIC